MSVLVAKCSGFKEDRRCLLCLPSYFLTALGPSAVTNVLLWPLCWPLHGVESIHQPFLHDWKIKRVTAWFNTLAQGAAGHLLRDPALTCSVVSVCLDRKNIWGLLNFKKHCIQSRITSGSSGASAQLTLWMLVRLRLWFSCWEKGSREAGRVARPISDIQVVKHLLCSWPQVQDTCPETLGLTLPSLSGLGLQWRSWADFK